MLNSVFLLSLSLGLSVAAPVPAPTAAVVVDAAVAIPRDAPLGLDNAAFGTVQSAVNEVLPGIAKLISNNGITQESLAPMIVMLVTSLEVANTVTNAVNIPINLRQLDGLTGAAGPVLDIPVGLVDSLVSEATSLAPLRRQLGDVAGTVGSIVEVPADLLNGLLGEVGSVAALRRQLGDLAGTAGNVLEVPANLINGGLGEVGSVLEVPDGVINSVVGGVSLKKRQLDSVESTVGSVVEVPAGLVNELLSTAGSLANIKRQLDGVAGTVGSVVEVPADLLGGLLGNVGSIASLKKRQLEGLEAVISSIVNDVSNVLAPLVKIGEIVPGVAPLYAQVDAALEGLVKSADSMSSGLINAVASNLPQPVADELHQLSFQLTLEALGI